MSKRFLLFLYLLLIVFLFVFVGWFFWDNYSSPLVFDEPKIFYDLIK